jgi:hypothetical protein
MSKRKNVSKRRRFKLAVRKAGKEPTFTEAFEDLLKRAPKRKLTIPVRGALKPSSQRARVARREAARAAAKRDPK